MASHEHALLEVEDLEVNYHVKSGRVHALSDVSFEVEPGEIWVSSASRVAVSRLSGPHHGAAPAERRDHRRRDPAAARHHCESARSGCASCGREMAIVFQDPLTSLNPTFTVGQQMVDAQRATSDVGRSNRA